MWAAQPSSYRELGISKALTQCLFILQHQPQGHGTGVGGTACRGKLSQKAELISWDEEQSKQSDEQ